MKKTDKLNGKSIFAHISAFLLTLLMAESGTYVDNPKRDIGVFLCIFMGVAVFLVLMFLYLYLIHVGYIKYDMLKIKFHPESDLLDFTEAVKEYEKIWAEEGEKIVNKWEEVTSLKFQETEINAVVADLVSCSHPLTLHHSLNHEAKLGNIIHELGHRLLYKRVIGIRRKTPNQRHSFLFAVFKDVLLELYGDGFLQKVIERESDPVRPNNYAEAWNWISQLETKEKRQRFFKQVLSGDFSSMSL